MENIFGFFLFDKIDLELSWVSAFFLAGIVFLILRIVLSRANFINLNPYWVWYLELILLPLLVFSIEKIIISQVIVWGQLEMITTINQMTYTLLWLIGAWLISRGLKLFFWESNPARYAKVSNLLKGLVSTCVYLFAFYGIVAFVFDKPMTGLIISSGVVAGILGLAMQSSLSDLFSGIAISIERPFSINDWIELDNGTLGCVSNINWRSTHMVSWNNSLYVVSNSKMASATIHNYSRPDKVYAHWFYVHVPAKIPPILVRRILLESCVTAKRVLNTPAPVIRTSEAGLNYKYMVFINFEDYPGYFAGMDELLMEVWIHCAKAGFSPASISQETILRRGEKIHFEELSLEIFIQEVELFHSLSESERLSLIGNSKVKYFKAEDVIVQQEEKGDSLFIILAGQVFVTIGETGKKVLEVARLGAGQYFGEMSLLAGDPRTANVISATDCQVLEISKATLQPLLNNRPALIEELAKIVAQRQLENQSKLDEQNTKTLSEQLRDLTNKLVGRIQIFMSKTY